MPDLLNTPHVSENIPRLGNSFSHWLGRTVLRLLGWTFYGEFPDSKKMIIAVGPHTSNWDFVVGLAVIFYLRLKVSFLGKHSIFIPPFDRLLKRWGGIPVQRHKAQGVVQQLVETMNSREQMILALSPEGTRSRIERWKTGFLQIANQANVPVVLVSFDYGKKQIGFGPMMNISENIDLEMTKVLQFYANVQAKFPDKVCTSPTQPSGEKD
jgi:1-acyl-sn-glycerol-3-phosphate acyltransferase